MTKPLKKYSKANQKENRLVISNTMEQPHTCKYCKKSFTKLTTLNNHMCVKKRRYVDIDTAGSRFGFRAFQRFYNITMQSKKAKTIDEFINSPYYIDFAKFGNYLAILKPVYIDKYIDFVILNSVNLKDWTKEFVYETYVVDLVRKEPAESAAERTITEIMEWCNRNNAIFDNFFSTISANEAAYLIKTGRISPWVLYLAPSGENLMTRFNEEHGKIIGSVIDPGFWSKRFKQSNEDVDYIKGILEVSGL